MKSLLIAAGIALLACSARANEAKAEGFGELTVDQVADLVAKHDADVFDNNGRDDYQKGHVPTAKWVSFKVVKESDLPKDRSRKLVFYCANPH
jgi:rhodanese-related sulfurtransferase